MLDIQYEKSFKFILIMHTWLPPHAPRAAFCVPPTKRAPASRQALPSKTYTSFRHTILFTTPV